MVKTASMTIIRPDGKVEDRHVRLSRKQRGLMDKAITAASLSTCKHRHGAVLEKNGNVLAVGVNVLKNDPTKFHEWNRWLSVHAEDAVTRVHQNGEAEGGVVYVARLSADGNPVMSRPCKACQRLMREIGVKKIVWTDSVQLDKEGNKIKYERHESRG